MFQTGSSQSATLTLRLSGWMVNLEVKGLRVRSLHHGHVAARPFVGLGQSVGPPVRPVNLSAVHGDGEGVRQILMSSQNLNQPRAVVLG